MHMNKKYAQWLLKVVTLAGCASNPILPDNQRRAYHDAFREAWFQDVPAEVRQAALKLHGPLFDEMSRIDFNRRYNNLWGGYGK